VKPGDILLVQSNGALPRLIRLGERLRRKGPWCQWSHIAVIVSPEGDTIEAQARGVVRSQVSAHPVRQVADFGLTDAQRAAAVAFAESCVGVKYGYLTILSIALDIFTPHLPRFRAGRTLICSELGARALEHGGWICPLLDTGTVEPSDLAYWSTH
jgi:hypothetical protein